MRLLQTILSSLMISFAFTLLLLAPSAGPQGVNAIRLPGLAPDLGLNLQAREVLKSPRSEESPEHFWDQVNNLGDKVVNYTNALLKETAKLYPAVQSSISSLQHQISSTLSSPGIQTLRSELEQSVLFLNTNSTNFTAGFVDLTKWSNDLSTEFELIMDQFQIEFPLPSEAPNHEERVKLINTLMDRLEDGFVKVANMTHYGVDQEKTREIFESIRSGMVGALVTVGDIAEQHPILLEATLFAVTILVFPEECILRPLFSPFGFGPLGPVKGSTAAWAQSRFWGGTVTKGSWFARLQQAGMTGRGWGSIPKAVLGVLGAGAGLVLGLFDGVDR